MKDELIDRMNQDQEEAQAVTEMDLRQALAASRLHGTGITLEHFSKILFDYYTPEEINIMLVNKSIYGGTN